MSYRFPVIKPIRGTFMAIRVSIAKSLVACFLTVAAGTALAPAAFAQHVVTDNEAGKLTFDSLTATPHVFVHRVAYRPARISWAQPTRFRTERMVHAVSYRRSIRDVGVTSHFGISHRRRRS